MFGIEYEYVYQIDGYDKITGERKYTMSSSNNKHASLFSGVYDIDRIITELDKKYPNMRWEYSIHKI